LVESCEGVDTSAEVTISVILDHFLCGIEVDAEGICADTSDEVFDLLCGGLCGLDHAEIAEDENVGRDVSDEVAVCAFWIAHHGALGSKSKAEAVFLRDTREGAVDISSSIGAAGHAADHEGGAECFSE